MFTIVIALTLLADGKVQVLHSKQTFPTEEACVELLAEKLNELNQAAKDRVGSEGYLIAGRCLKGVGDPA